MTMMDGCRESRGTNARKGRPMTSTVDGRPRLIIADDNAAIRSALSMSLDRAFEIVGVAADCEQAVELARTSQPAGALVDVDMPKGGGLCAVRGIVEVSPDTAIVMLSGDESDGVVRELIQAGAMAYARKGTGPQVLTELITKSIKGHAAEAPLSLLTARRP